jgi:hypothetical protein
MAVDLLNMMSDGEIEEEFNSSVLTNIEIDKIFERSLQEDTYTMEEILENAPWNQHGDEDDEQYDAFKYYVNLAIDEWEPTAISKFNIDATHAENWAQEFQWQQRRMAYIQYQEWLRRKTEEVKHQDSIADFRDTQHSLLTTSSKATINLIAKLAARIETLDPDEIKAADIPKFVSAVSQFIDMTTEANAKFLTINELLALYEDDLDAKSIRDHINQASVTEIKPNATKVN